MLRLDRVPLRQGRRNGDEGAPPETPEGESGSRA